MNTLLRFLVLVAALWSPSIMANDNAGIFFHGTPPTPAQVAALAEGAKVKTSTEGAVTRIVVEWPDASLTINIDPDWNRDVQLSGIRGWVSRFPDDERSSEAVVSFLAELDRTTTAYGSIIAPGYDEEGKVAALLRELLGTSGGFFFSHQSFYSASGRRIIGLPGDPDVLGPK